VRERRLAASISCCNHTPIELGIFVLATVAFVEVGQSALAVVFAVASLATAGLSRRVSSP
jgi:hypothetical protein